MSNKPTALLTNDDGIDSCFLQILADSFKEEFEVFVAAPAREHSWISRAVSRNQNVKVESTTLADCKAWRVHGTPTDCVNLAIDHFLEHPPDIVVSGINIGFNVSLPLVLSSGTVAGALEGANWNCRALALSLVVPGDAFQALRENPSILPEQLQETLSEVAGHARDFALKRLEKPAERMVVDNLNYPFPTTTETQLRETILADLILGGIFEPASEEEYRFRYSAGRLLPSDHLTDRDCLEAGWISWSRLDYQKLRGSPMEQA